MMAREFPSFAAFADFLETRITAVDFAKHIGLDAAANMMCREAIDMIGREQANWPALAESTVEAKTAAGQVGRISATDPLYAKGDLRRSFHYGVGNAGFVWGSTDPVMRFHEDGTLHMPPRPVVSAVMFRHAEEAVHMVANRVMGAVAGKVGPLHAGRREEASRDLKLAAD